MRAVGIFFKDDNCRTNVLNLGTVVVSGYITFVGGCSPGHCSNIPGLYLLEANSTLSPPPQRDHQKCLKALPDVPLGQVYPLTPLENCCSRSKQPRKPAGVGRLESGRPVTSRL